MGAARTSLKPKSIGSLLLTMAIDGGFFALTANLLTRIGIFASVSFPPAAIIGIGAAIGATLFGIPHWIRSSRKAEKLTKEERQRVKEMEKLSKGRHLHLEKEIQGKGNIKTGNYIIRNGVLVSIHPSILAKASEHGSIGLSDLAIPITGIAPGVFDGLKENTRILIPASVENLDFSAFPKKAILSFENEETKGRLCKGLTIIDDGNGNNMSSVYGYTYKDKASGAKVFIEGETFQSRMLKMTKRKAWPEENTAYYERDAWRQTDKERIYNSEECVAARNQVARMKGLDLTGQVNVMRMCSELMSSGRCTYNEFVFILNATRQTSDDTVRLRSYIRVPESASKEWEERYNEYYRSAPSGPMGISKELSAYIDTEYKRMKRGLNEKILDEYYMEPDMKKRKEVRFRIMNGTDITPEDVRFYKETHGLVGTSLPDPVNSSKQNQLEENENRRQHVVIKDGIAVVDGVSYKRMDDDTEERKEKTDFFSFSLRKSVKSRKAALKETVAPRMR